MDRPSRQQETAGVLELLPKGYGFLRDPISGYAQQGRDAFVPQSLVQQFKLRAGSLIKGRAEQVRDCEGPRLAEIHEIDGCLPGDYASAKRFDELTPITPHSRLQLETGQQPVSTRVVDLLAPLGKGQRALIVAPPRTGKTVLLQQISQAIETNYPDVKLVMLLVDERPEEVTDMRRSVKGEVIASSLDHDASNHIRVAQLTVERCKRLAEAGQDVFLLIDSVTRLARAFNKTTGNTGRTMTGGLDIRALDIPKKLFASARAFEEGGSLTIVATALVDTGSRMDELIFQEFKGTGNMELVLDRTLADRRVWPAIDVSRSGTRREEKLLSPDALHAVTVLRRSMSTLRYGEDMEELAAKLARLPSNRAFIELIAASHEIGG
ncbi:MAG TPA: transcription termination factor Rho [Pirellulales bacterium]|nr:transcription termination factor Rho [Pirellulales bacterium]